jgi:deoxyribodipyrimidine photo-lyase
MSITDRTAGTARTRALVWFRRDLRMADNPALQAALDAGHAPVPVYVHAPEEEGAGAAGAAGRAWLARSLAALTASLGAKGSGIVVRRGETLATLRALVAETGAVAVYWNRLYEPALQARDARVEQALRGDGLHVETANAALLAEPWTVATGGGEPYRVFTPFWRNASQRLAGVVTTDAPARLPALPEGLAAGAVTDLRLAPTPAWDNGFWDAGSPDAWQPGEAGAQDMLEAFVEGALHGYHEQRDLPDRIGTSRLSPHLHFGELSPRQVVDRLARRQRPAVEERDLTRYLTELGWREFAHHLLHHFPHSVGENLNRRFDGFAWAPVDDTLLAAWQQGRTGVPLVDAGMRELWATGWMHNRVRMVVASFLTRNLRMHWRHGADWFRDTLVDHDLANNIAGWQWSAGSGADAAPYFRMLSPMAQSARFDPSGRYIRRWVPELAALPTPALFAPWEHPRVARELAPSYPAQPVVDPKASREAAIAAHQAMRQIAVAAVRA